MAYECSQHEQPTAADFVFTSLADGSTIAMCNEHLPDFLTGSLEALLQSQGLHLTVGPMPVPDEPEREVVDAEKGPDDEPAPGVTVAGPDATNGQDDPAAYEQAAAASNGTAEPEPADEPAPSTATD